MGTVGWLTACWDDEMGAAMIIGISWNSALAERLGRLGRGWRECWLTVFKSAGGKLHLNAMEE